MSNDETPSHVHNLLKQTGVITNETWTCSPIMFLIFATVSQMPRNQMNNGNANHMPTWIHPCPPDEQKEKAPVFDVLVIHSVLHYFRIWFVFKFEMVYVVLPPVNICV